MTIIIGQQIETKGGFFLLQITVNVIADWRLMLNLIVNRLLSAHILILHSRDCRYFVGN